MKYAVLNCLFFFSVLHASAQSSRDPNQAEKAAIDKIVQSVSVVVQQFANEDWELESGGPDAPGDYSVQINPDVPIGVAPFNDYHFAVKRGSAFWNAEIQPLANALQSPPADYNDKQAMDAYKKLRTRLVNQKDIYVEIHVNEKNLPIKPEKNSSRDLKIPGSYFSYKQSNNLVGTNHNLDNSYVLAFGNWKNAKTKYYSDQPFYEFPFTHPNATPSVENVVIIISGNESRIKELQSKIDWNKINEGLTL